MVFNINFPSQLTEEEELLQQKYAKLKKKKKALAATKAPKPEKQESVSDSLKRPAEAAADATEQAKKLLKLGAIKVEPDKREQQTFKRTKRQKEADKPPVGYHPFIHSAGGEGNEDKIEHTRPKQKFNLYDNFVRASDSKFESGDRPERRQPPRRGNTVYVHGHGVSEDVLRRTFANIGTIINVAIESDKNCGFVTFEKMDSADQAISEFNGSMVGGVQLRVSMARNQPSIEPAPTTETGINSWASIAASSSQKGTHQDKRELVTYDEDDIF